MQAIPDYTDQLRRIADALAQGPTWWPTVIGTLAGTALGFISGVLLDIVRHRRTRFRMRDAVYYELAANYVLLLRNRDRAMKLTGRFDNLLSDLQFKNLDALDTKPEVKIEIPNIAEIEDLYRVLRVNSVSSEFDNLAIVALANGCIHAYHDKIRRRLIDVSRLKRYGDADLRATIAQLELGQEPTIP